MKISFISTVFNEEATVKILLNSVLDQSRKPDEIILVDGGSTDKTVAEIENYENVKFFVEKGNRSVGRNYALENSTGDIIVCSDAGCVLEKNWLKNIVKPFSEPRVDVVAGYYRGLSKNIFQKCLIPYVLVMPDSVNPRNFLPATRSMAFRKSVWEKIGGFDEKLSHNEDHAFARKLREKGFNIVFAKDAIVNWAPPSSLPKSFIMFFRFAYGDAEAGIYRPKALFVLGRYLFGLVLLISALYSSSSFLIILTYVLLINYNLWAILKNYWYVKNPLAIIFLPMLQLSSDIAVISGTILGFLKRIGK